jgi:anti-sigma factor RsiW
MEPAATQPMELDCDKCRELLSGYVDHELSVDEIGAVERHLANCPRCATESTHLVGLKNIVQHWDGIRGTEEFHEEVLQGLIRESQMLPAKQFTEAAEKARAESLRQSQAQPAQSSHWVWLAVVAALAGAAAGALIFFLTR